MWFVYFYVWLAWCGYYAYLRFCLAIGGHAYVCRLTERWSQLPITSARYRVAAAPSIQQALKAAGYTQCLFCQWVVSNHYQHLHRDLCREPGPRGALLP